MLHRSFKPAKCKTSLKLATSRLKLMKNKKLVQINQMKRELSQLLETGQDRTARIRVEHVIREEKMVASYELIEIYCELIAARLPIIESQKSCPIDLKEAVTSVIFASPRCSDIPELQDVRKHFTTKYGKEFISAAIELRPDSGVGRMLIEKLSAVAPDVRTKTKVLSAIAEEYNIKWDPEAFEEKESKPPDDLLNGPNTFEKASVMHADPPKYQAAPNVQVPYSHGQGGNEPVSYSQQNSGSSTGTGNYASTDTGGIQTSSAASLADERASGRGPERMLDRQSYSRDGNDNSYDRQNWNMEFKDATAAAQAAAESAERASMAARAAAELSRQDRRSSGHYSTDSHKSNFREEEPRRYGASNLPAEHYSRGSHNNSFSDKKPKGHDQQVDRSENEEKAAERSNEDGYGRRSSRAASLSSRNDSIHDDKSVNTQTKAYGYSQESSFQEKFVKAEKGTTSSPEISIQKQTRRRASDVELDNRQLDSFKPDNYRYQGEGMNRNQSSTSSSRPHSMNSSDEYNVPGSDRRKIGNDNAEDRPVGVDQGNMYKETSKTSMYDNVADDVISDEAESDEDSPRFDRGPQFDEVDAKSFFPSPGRESPIHSMEHTNQWSPRRTMDESVKKSGYEEPIFSGTQFLPEHSEHSAKSVNSSEPDNLLPAAFDPSDGPVFDDEDEPDQMNGQGLDLESPKRGKSRVELTDLLESTPSLPSPTTEEEKGLQPQQSSNFSLRDEFQDDAQVTQSSDSDSGQELNLGTLPGGFRNKGYRRPPYTRNPSGNASSLPDNSPERSPNVEPMPTPIIKNSINSTAGRAEHKESSVSPTASGSDLNYSSMKSTQDETRKSRFEPPPLFFDHDDDDSEDDIPKGNSSSRVHLGTGLSRRTKAAPSTSGTSTFSRNRVEPDTKPVNSASVTGRKPSRHTYSDETPPEPRSRASSFEQETSKPILDPKISRREEGHRLRTAEQPSSGQSYADPRTHSASSRQEATRAKPEFKSSKREESLKSQAAEQPSSPQRKRVESGDPEVEKADTKPVNSASVAGRKPSRHTYSDETPPEPRSHASSFKQETSKPVIDPKISRREESYKSRTAEQPSSGQAYADPRTHSTSSRQEATRAKPETKSSKREENLKSQAAEQPSSPQRKRGESGDPEAEKASNSGGGTSTGEKKASHVHPKLPEYDDIAARLQALRMNR